MEAPRDGFRNRAGRSEPSTFRPWAESEIVSDCTRSAGTVRLITATPSGWADLDQSLQLALTGGFQSLLAPIPTSAPWPMLFAVNTHARPVLFGKVSRTVTGASWSSWSLYLPHTVGQSSSRRLDGGE